jgi:phospholipid-translocating ATPase
LEFVKFSVGKNIYGRGVTEIAKASAKARNETLVDDLPKDVKFTMEGVRFYDPKIDNYKYLELPDREEICEFFLLLSICHDAIPEKGLDGEIIINSSSPGKFNLIPKMNMH